MPRGAPSGGDGDGGLDEVAAESGPAINPIEQFSLSDLVPITIGGRHAMTAEGHAITLGGYNISLTNSALFMLIAVALTCGLMAVAARGGATVPTRMQAMAEMAYEFIAGMVRSAAGETGMRFFPMVFCIFMFVLILNSDRLIPYSFSVTSQIIVTVSLALLVFFTVVIVGIKEHGLHFFKLFVPARRADLHSAAGRGDRDHLVSYPPGEPFGASVREHARWPHHGVRLRRLRRDAAGRGRRSSRRSRSCHSR